MPIEMTIGTSDGQRNQREQRETNTMNPARWISPSLPMTKQHPKPQWWNPTKSTKWRTMQPNYFASTTNLITLALTNYK